MSVLDKDLERVFKLVESEHKVHIGKFYDVAKSSVESISSGSLSLNYVFGCGGYPRGRIVEIYGKPSSGKSLLALKLISEIQKAGGQAALIDAEYAFDPHFAELHGVDVKSLTYCRPDYGEQALDTIRTLCKEGLHDVIIVDSVASLVPKAEHEEDINDKTQMALLARMLSRGLRMLTPVVGSSKAVVVFINQVRTDVGAMYGDGDTTPGGQALPFYASVRLKVRVVGGSQVKNAQDEVIGHSLTIKAIKNKVGFPQREATVPLLLRSGFDMIEDLCYLTSKSGILQQAGAWLNDVSYSAEGRKFNGWEKFREALRAEPEYLESIRTRALAAIVQAY